MSDETTKLFRIVVIIITSFIILAGAVKINGRSDFLYSKSGFVIDEGNFRVIDIDCNIGEVTFSFVVNNPVNAYIMSESQFTSYYNGYDGGSLDAKNSDSEGTISCVITENQKLFFIIENDGAGIVNVSKFDISQG